MPDTENVKTTESNVLSLKFATTASSRTINLDDPIENIDGENVSLTMEGIVAANTLCDAKGNLVESIKSADLITTTKIVETLF